MKHILDSPHIMFMGLEDLQKRHLEVEIDKSEGIYASVRDNGAGIDPRLEGYLFEWIPQFPAPEELLKIRTPRELVMGGLGDALFQLKNYVLQRNGTVGYENFGAHNGARFWFKIPSDTL